MQYKYEVIKMPKTIEPKLRKIGDYLHLEEDAIFSIPEYQRAYSLQIDNCDKLWQDIMDFIESGSKDRYFFGTIIINCQDDDQKLVLIDGQQRTTTFLLLLKALLIRIIKAIKATSNDEESESLCLGLKERRKEIMKILYRAEPENSPYKADDSVYNDLYKRTKIMENLSINERYPNELSIILGAVDYKEAADNVTQIKYRQKDNRYTNFFRNFKFFCEKIDELSESELNNFAKAVTQECEVIEIRSWQVEQAIMMFNSLNSDGMPLCDSDIISAKLYASADRKGEIAEFNALWKQLAENVEKLMETNVATLDGIFDAADVLCAGS